MTDDPLLSFLAAAGLNLTDLARQGRLRAAYGREAEVDAVLRALSRGQGAQPLVVGPPKVGKTAVIHEVVRRLEHGDCPAPLAGLTVYELAPAPLIMELGAEWRNQLPGFLRDVTEHAGVLLYLRDLSLAGAAGKKGHEATLDWVRALCEQLQGSSMRCVVEMRANALRRLDAAVPELAEAFTRVALDEPPAGDVADIVEAACGDLEAAYAVRIERDARDAAVSLTRRFRVGQAFPGKAIALLEEAAARGAEARRDAEGPRAGQDLPTAGDRPGAKDRPMVGDPPAVKDRSDAEDRPAVKDRPVDEDRPPPATVIDAPGVAAVFSDQTGLSRQLTDDGVPFDEGAVRRHLSERVIGQEQAIEVIAQTISLLRARLNDPRRPLGVFLFLGPTGVGKTELSKALAAWLFGDAGRLARFNMADFTDWYDFEKLFGDEDETDDLAKRRGQLTLLLADEPFAVLLLDEFEKAHPNVYQRFLQLFDEGTLINADGETVNLRNTIIIATSNFGAQAYTSAGIGFERPSDEAAIQAYIETAFENQFTPEFVNRLDRVCFFRPLGKHEVQRIARREIEHLLQREGIAGRGLVVEMDDEVVENVVERGYSRKFGARHLKRQIERAIAFALARAVLGQPTRPGDLVRLFVRGDRIHAAVVPDEAERPPAAVEVAVAPDGETRRFTLQELREALPDLEARVARLEAFHRIEEVRARSKDLMAAMSDPGFWDDPHRAEADLAALGDLTRVVDLCDGLRRATGDMAAALALIAEKGAGSMIGEAARQYRYLLRELPRAELDLLLADPWDRRDAFVLLHAPPAEADAGTWPEDLLGAYRGWAARRGFEAALLGETRDAAGRLASAALAVRGHGAYGLLKGETGAHRRLQPRADGGREAIHVRVEVVPELAGEVGQIPDPHDVEATARAINARGPLLGRLRSHASATHHPTGTTVSLTSDRPADESRALAERILAACLAARARRAALPSAPPDADALWGAVVRTYCVYKSHYVRDMRTGVTETHVRRVMEGHLDGFLEAYLRAVAEGGSLGGS